ncbi:hypothetical protein AK812_SmicGene26354 [Symbiodinium microadriaticum]|uniref:Uncharacterized protein n=1 Tax=Symbiodinium microadriaticum TaxID=2951 RepID=A0A1Q9D9N9_SYMMI|nr:hypothetical protein AK812_SmicGene26354 [Symbiodinium microadriaticum]
MGRKVLGSKMSSQLLLMEYLVRLLNISSKLSDAARRKLESPQQTAIAGVISVFRQQLSLWLRGSKKQPPPPQHVVKKGDVLEEVEDVCLQALVQILCDTWGGSREAVMKSVAAIRSELALVRIAPEPFVRSSSGCRAIKALGDLTATDLEAIFRAPQCPPELKCIFLVPEPDEQMAAGIGWHVLRRMSQAGPLSELEFLQHVTLQPPLPKNNVVQPGETPPLNPRMMMSVRRGLQPQEHARSWHGFRREPRHRAVTLVAPAPTRTTQAEYAFFPGGGCFEQFGSLAGRCPCCEVAIEKVSTWPQVAKPERTKSGGWRRVALESPGGCFTSFAEFIPPAAFREFTAPEALLL